MMQIRDLDVSHLPAPEPMAQILKQLAGLKPGQCLRVYHRKEPVPLYDKLAQMGFAHRTVQHHEQSFTMFIVLAENQQALPGLDDAVRNDYAP